MISARFVDFTTGLSAHTPDVRAGLRPLIWSRRIGASVGATHLYFKVESQEDFLERLRKLNIKPQSTDEVVVTVLDPDGRKVMFGTA